MDKRVIIARALICAGANPTHAGFAYIIDSCMLCYERPELLDGLVTKVLYPEVAKMHGVSAARVERGIRYCRSGINTKHTTNSSFIGALVWFLRYYEEKGEAELE